MAAVTEARLTEVYNQITTETSTRLDAGEATLERINQVLLNEIAKLNVEINLMRENTAKGLNDLRT